MNSQGNNNVFAMEISPREVKAKLDAAGNIRLIDVREPSEFRLAHIEGAELIPMNKVPAGLQRLEAMADEQMLIVYCHHGVSSLNVVHWLREQGVEACQSLSGVGSRSRSPDRSAGESSRKCFTNTATAEVYP